MRNLLNHLFILLFFFSLIPSSHSACKFPRIRRSWHSLNDDEKSLWIEALNLMKTSGLYDQFTEVHYSFGNRMYAHGASGFFPWHRWFIYVFENKLRELGPKFECITIPYWPSEMDAGAEMKSPLLSKKWFGSNVTDDLYCVQDGPFAKWLTTDNGCLKRSFQQQYGYVGEAQVMDIIVNYPIYGTEGVLGFRAKFEGSPHAAPHNFLGGLGGHMGTMLSSNDPFFYVLHSNIDRIWSLWQDCHDYDKLDPSQPIPSSAFIGTHKSFDDAYTPMPFFWEREFRNHQFFNYQITPADIFWIKNSTLLDYSYEPGDRLRELIDIAYGECKWDWFEDGYLYPQDKKRNLHQKVQLPNGETEETLAQKYLLNMISSMEISRKKIHDSIESFNDTHIPNTPKESLLKAIRTIGGRRTHLEEVDASIKFLSRSDNPSAKPLATALRKIRTNIKKHLYPEKSSFHTPKHKDPFWDEKAKMRIHKFHDPRVQKAYEKIIKENPYPHVPKYRQLQMLAVAECQIHGGKPHSSEEWIVMQGMMSTPQVFSPVCKYRY